MEENFIVIRDPKTFYFHLDWLKDVDKMKNDIEQLLFIINMETIFMNTENSKTSEPHKFVLNLSQRLDLRSSNKHVTLQNLSIYYSWKNIRNQYKHNKLRIIAPTWNDEF